MNNTCSRKERLPQRCVPDFVCSLVRFLTTTLKLVNAEDLRAHESTLKARKSQHGTSGKSLRFETQKNVFSVPSLAIDCLTDISLIR